MKQKKMILKNTKKYSILKLAKGLDLGQFMFYSANYSVRNNFKEASDWVYTGDERVFFKSGETGYYGFVSSHKVVNELLYDELAKQVGVPVANYEPASLDDVSSLISHDVTYYTDFELGSICGMMNVPFNYEITFEEIIKNFAHMQGFEDYRYDQKKIIVDLYKMMVLDSLTFQEDRHDENVHLLVNSNRKVFQLSPIIDNEYAFGAKTLNFFLEMQSFRKGSMDKQSFLAKHASNMRIVMTKKTRDEEYTKKYSANVKDLIKFAYDKPECKHFLVNCLKTLDIDKAIANVEKMGYQISDDYKEYLKDLLEMSKEIFAENIKEFKTSVTSNKSDSDIVK